MSKKELTSQDVLNIVEAANTLISIENENYSPYVRLYHKEAETVLGHALNVFLKYTSEVLEGFHYDV